MPTSGRRLDTSWVSIRSSRSMGFRLPRSERLSRAEVPFATFPGPLFAWNQGCVLLAVAPRGCQRRLKWPRHLAESVLAAAGKRRERRARGADPRAPHRSLRALRLERAARRGRSRRRRCGRRGDRFGRDRQSARRGQRSHAFHGALLCDRGDARAAARRARIARHRSDERRRPADQPHRRGLSMRNADVVARSLAAVWHPCTQMKQHERFPLVPVARAEGPWLHDFDGKKYLDAVSSWWVNLFGHSHPYINAAIRGQLDSLEHVMLAGFTHEPVIELSERLARVAPGKLGHAFFASDGACAAEIALKMAFHYWANRGKARKR